MRKLLKSNSCTSVEKMCRVVMELHTCYTRTMGFVEVIDIKHNKNYVAIEWELELLELINLLIILSMIFVTLFSIYLICL